MKRKGTRSPPTHPPATYRSFASISKRVAPRPSISLRHQSTNRVSHDLSFLPKLRNSAVFRPSIMRQSTDRGIQSVYILEDGARIDPTSGIRGFPYIITEAGSVFQLLRASCERLAPDKRFSYVFSFTGTAIQSLDEVSEFQKVLLVSEQQEFIGVSWERQEETKDLSEAWVCEKMRLEEGAGEGRKRMSRFHRAASIRVPPRPSFSPKRDSKPAHIRLNPVAKVDELLKPLSPEQIQSLAETYGLSRGRIHGLYARYKTLLALHVCRNPGCGIDKATFVTHLRGALIYGRELLTRLFEAIDTNGNGYLSWVEFLRAISYLSVGTKREKVSLYFRVLPTQLYDCNTSGSLSFHEVHELCIVALSHAGRDSIVEDIADYFAAAVFKKAGVPKDAEITLERLHEVLEQEGDEEFMQLFCFMDVD